MLHQKSWPPQSPDLNPVEIVWDELDRRVKEKQPTSAQHMRELLQDCWKSIPGEASLQSCQGYFEDSKIENNLICFTLFWLLHGVIT